MLKLFQSSLRSVSYKMKVRFTIMLACLVAVIVAGTGLTYWGMIGIKKTILQDAQNVANLIGSRNDTALQFDNSDFTEQNMQILKDNPQVLAACIYDNKGNIFASFVSDNSNIECQLSDGWGEGGYTDMSEFHSEYLYISRNILSSNQVTELQGKIVLYASLQEMYNYLEDQVVAVVLIALLALVVCYLIARKLESFLSAPVMELIKTAQSISSETDFSFRASNPYSNELGQIIESFNMVLSQREEVHQQLKVQHKDYVTAYNNSIKIMKMMQNEFDVPYKALVVLSQLLQKKTFGSDINSYLQYIGDFETNMECYKSCIEASLALTESYERSLSKDIESAPLMQLLEPGFTKLPDLRSKLVDHTDGELSDINVNIRTEAFEKTLEISYAIIEILLYAGELDSSITLTIRKSAASLELEFYLLINVKTDNKPKTSDNLDDLISNIKSGNFIIDPEEEIACHPSTSVVLNNANIKPEEYKYLTDSLKYIANANNIQISDDLKYNSLRITMDLSKCLNLSKNTLQTVY